MEWCIGKERPSLCDLEGIPEGEGPNYCDIECSTKEECPQLCDIGKKAILFVIQKGEIFRKGL